MFNQLKTVFSLPFVRKESILKLFVFIYKDLHLILKKGRKKSKMELIKVFSITAEVCIAITFLLNT